MTGVLGAGSALGAATLVSLFAKSKTDERAKTNLVSAAVCFIAAVHYAAIYTGTNPRSARMSDWLLTCPLLAFEMTYLLGHSLHRCIAAAVAAGTMIAIGGKQFAISCGLLCLTAVLIFAPEKGTRRREIPSWVIALFFALWPLYPIADYLMLDQMSYSILDTLSKGLFAGVIALI